MQIDLLAFHAINHYSALIISILELLEGNGCFLLHLAHFILSLATSSS